MKASEMSNEQVDNQMNLTKACENAKGKLVK